MFLLGAAVRNPGTTRHYRLIRLLGRTHTTRRVALQARRCAGTAPDVAQSTPADWPADPSAPVTGSWVTGKFTELAMKHRSEAGSCRAAARSIIEASRTVTAGLSTTERKRPPPSAVSSMIPSASSV